MALIAVDAVVDVPRHPLVLEVCRIVAAMAAGALEDRVVVGIDMAGLADAIGIAMVDGEPRVLTVVKSRTAPGGGVVAILARCWKELWLCRVTRVG